MNQWTPAQSPFSKQSPVTKSPFTPTEKFSSRFIPCRSAGNLMKRFDSFELTVSSRHKMLLQKIQKNAETPQNDQIIQQEEDKYMYNALLDSQFYGDNANNPPQTFKFRVVDKHKENCRPNQLINYQQLPNFNSSNRKIHRTPFKVLDAPNLQDDFYLNLVDWSSLNTLSVGLGTCVYLWSAQNSKVTKLCDIKPDQVTSVAWSKPGSVLAVGTNSGETLIWDIVKQQTIRQLLGHDARVGSISWYQDDQLSTGSRDRSILHRDLRSPEWFVGRLLGHNQEVCGLKWGENQLASGGNDNKLILWQPLQSTHPIIKFNQHKAAVKAIAWSPHQHGLLASGGGTADRCIRFWNTLTQQPLQYIDTGSQICNLMFSKTVNEIVSTHGYSQNQIIVWKYPSLQKVCTLTGHTYRVLYLSMSPDGQTIVTGAGDETLRFWNTFPISNQKSQNQFPSKLIPSSWDMR